VSLPHLAARVAALFRRIDALRRPDNAAEMVRRGALSIDGEKMQTTWNGKPVTLSLTEFWIVHALARNPGHVKNRQQLMDAANVVLDDNTITSHIKRVRRKFSRSTELRCHSNRVRNGLSLGRVSIRLQLLIVALTTLCCRGPAASTRASSRRRCATRRKMPWRRARAPSPTRYRRSRSTCTLATRDMRNPSPSQGDLYVFPLHTQPLLDGYREDWDLPAIPNPCRPQPATRASAGGIHRRYLFLYLEVDDPISSPSPPTCIRIATASIAST
jgi:DNA-binding winged helix-turn-helix (wHTH) protein